MSSQQDQAGEAGRPGGSGASGGPAVGGRGADALPPPRAMPGPVPADPDLEAGDPVTGAPQVGGPVTGARSAAGSPSGSAPARPGAAGPGATTGAGGAGGTTRAGGAGLTRRQAAWKTAPNGTTVFRLMPPLVLWWLWVAFFAFNAIDLAIQSPNWFSLEVGLAILVVTGVIYACAFRPKVISDAGGLTIRNPFRDYRVPWGGIAGVYLGDSVEIQCDRPDPHPGKTVYSWALYSPRRTRAKADLRQGFGTRRERDRRDARARRRYQVPDPTAFGRLPGKAKELASQHPSHVMAGELARRLEEARKNGAPEGTVTGWWAWPPIAAVLIPAIALAVVAAVA